MNLFSYIENYKDKDFYAEKFNEVDNVIFSMLSYLDFSNILGVDFSKKMKLKDASIMYLENNNQVNKKFPQVKFAISILKAIYKTKRYENVFMYNYRNINNSNCIFRAITFEYLKNNIYISFEGTDDLLLNWQEDFEISYLFPTNSQKYSFNYLATYLFTFKKIIVGGHSKGGNLALSSVLQSNFLLRNKIKKVYINDGLGLRKEEFNSIRYKKIADRLVYLVPDYSIVSFLLESGENLNIIKSKNKSIFSHSPKFWLIEDNKFIRSNISDFSYDFKIKFSKWLYKYSDLERKHFTKEIFLMFRECNINSLLDLIAKKTIFIKLIINSRNFDNETKNMLKDLIKILTTGRK